MVQKYQVLFKGEVANGDNFNQTKYKLAKLFNLKKSEIEKLFSGKAIIIKKRGRS